jgi:hypothetical protein
VDLHAPRYVDPDLQMEQQARSIELLQSQSANPNPKTAQAARKVLAQIGMKRTFLIEGKNLESFLAVIGQEAGQVAAMIQKSELKSGKTFDLFFPRLALAVLTFSGMYLVDYVPEQQFLLRLGVGVGALAGSMAQLAAAAGAPTPEDLRQKARIKLDHQKATQIFLESLRDGNASYLEQGPVQFFFSEERDVLGLPSLLIVTTRVT